MSSIMSIVSLLLLANAHAGFAARFPLPTKVPPMILHSEATMKHVPRPRFPNILCKYDGSPAIDLMFNHLRFDLPNERLNIRNKFTGLITTSFSIAGGKILSFEDMVRLRSSCIYSFDTSGQRIHIPFTVELREVDFYADLIYDVRLYSIKGNYSGTMEHVTINGTIEAWPFENRMTLRDFNITSSNVRRSVANMNTYNQFVAEWVAGYFVRDNTPMYERLARTVFQREVANFKDYPLLRTLATQPASDRKNQKNGAPQPNYAPHQQQFQPNFAQHQQQFQPSYGQQQQQQQQQQFQYHYGQSPYGQMQQQFQQQYPGYHPPPPLYEQFVLNEPADVLEKMTSFIGSMNTTEITTTKPMRQPALTKV